MLIPAIDCLTALELLPNELVEHAARTGCSSVGLFVQGARYFPFPESGLIGNRTAQAELRNKCDGLGVGIDCIELFAIDKHCDPETYRHAFEIGAFLGAASINALSFDRNPERLGTNYAKLCEVASEYGLTVLSEVHRAMGHSSITAAVECFDRFNLDAKIVLDSLHFFRYGGQIEEIVRHRDRIGRAQLSDGPLVVTDAQYDIEALYRRMIPGYGELPLAEFLANLPDNIVVGVETPCTEYRLTERIDRAVEGFHKVAAEADRLRK